MNHSPERRKRREKDLEELLNLAELDESARANLELAYGDKAETTNTPSLERDLRSTEWICNKAKANNSYAQNIYAALCNTDWQKIDVMPILSDQTWGCSWRYAGGIVADMLETGDYLDWYCSGIGPMGNGNGHGNDPDKKYVSEGQVTDEILEDFKKLGWRLYSSDQVDI